MKAFNKQSLAKELTIDANAIGIPSGAAKVFIDRTISTATKSLSNKSIVTETDVKIAIAKELKKYHPDLAYVYLNRDTII